MSLYIRIGAVTDLKSSECQTKDFQFMVTMTATRSVQMTSQTHEDMPNFSNDLLEFNLKTRENNELVFQFMNLTDFGPVSIAGIKMPLSSIPSNKKVKLYIPLINYTIATPPWFAIEIHYDTKGASPFEVRSGHLHHEIFLDTIKSQIIRKFHKATDSQDDINAYINNFNQLNGIDPHKEKKKHSKKQEESPSNSPDDGSSLKQLDQKPAPVIVNDDYQNEDNLAIPKFSIPVPDTHKDFVIGKEPEDEDDDDEAAARAMFQARRRPPVSAKARIITKKKHLDLDGDFNSGSTEFNSASQLATPPSLPSTFSPPVESLLQDNAPPPLPEMPSLPNMPNLQGSSDIGGLPPLPSMGGSSSEISGGLPPLPSMGGGSSEISGGLPPLPAMGGSSEIGGLPSLPNIATPTSDIGGGFPPLPNIGGPSSDLTPPMGLNSSSNTSDIGPLSSPLPAVPPSLPSTGLSTPPSLLGAPSFPSIPTDTAMQPPPVVDSSSNYNSGGSSNYNSGGSANYGSGGVRHVSSAAKKRSAHRASVNLTQDRGNVYGQLGGLARDGYSSGMPGYMTPPAMPPQSSPFKAPPLADSAAAYATPPGRGGMGSSFGQQPQYGTLQPGQFGQFGSQYATLPPQQSQYAPPPQQQYQPQQFASGPFQQQQFASGSFGHQFASGQPQQYGQQPQYGTLQPGQFAQAPQYGQQQQYVQQQFSTMQPQFQQQYAQQYAQQQQQYVPQPNPKEVALQNYANHLKSQGYDDAYISNFRATRPDVFEQYAMQLASM